MLLPELRNNSSLKITCINYPRLIKTWIASLTQFWTNKLKRQSMSKPISNNAIGTQLQGSVTLFTLHYQTNKQSWWTFWTSLGTELTQLEWKSQTPSLQFWIKQTNKYMEKLFVQIKPTLLTVICISLQLLLSIQLLTSNSYPTIKKAK